MTGIEAELLVSSLNQPFRPGDLGSPGFAWPSGKFRHQSLPVNRWRRWLLRRQGISIQHARRARDNRLVMAADAGELNLEMYFGGSRNTVWIDGQVKAFAGLKARIECHGDDGLVVICQRDHQLSKLTVRLFGSGQTCYWGTGSTANDAHLIVSGDRQSILVGSQCMFSVNCWLRNTDQHALIDIASAQQINRNLGSIRVASRTWMGQDSLILGACCVGEGAVIGAKSLVNKSVEPQTLVAGVPARLIREGVAWDRKLLI